MKQFYMSLIIFSMIFSGINNDINGNDWQEWKSGEKEVFLKGFYSSQFTLNNHLEDAIKYDSAGDPYWQKPFSVVMYEQNLKEFMSVKIGLNVAEMSNRIGAFYGNFENKRIPIIEAIRIICLRADGNIERADWFVLQNRRNIGAN
jgi:hypothetical protein